MTEDIIEAVARAIWESPLLQPARGAWEGNNNATEQCCRRAAQAAITAYEAARGDVVVDGFEAALRRIDGFEVTAEASMVNQLFRLKNIARDALSKQAADE